MSQLSLSGDCVAMCEELLLVGCSSLSGNCWDGEVCLLEASGAKRASLRTYGGNCAVQSLRLGKQTFFFAAGDDGAVYCWDYRKVLEASQAAPEEGATQSKRAKKEEALLRPLFNFYDHQNTVSGLSSRDKHVLSSSWDGTAKLWDMEAPAWPLSTFQGGGRELLDVHCEGPSSFVTAGRAVQLWDSREKACTASIDLAARATRFNQHNPTQLAIGTQGGGVLLFDCRSLSRPVSSAALSGSVTRLEFSPGCAGLLAVTSSDARLRVLQGDDLTVAFESLHHTESCQGVTWMPSAPDKHMLATVSWDATCKTVTFPK